VVKLVAVDFDGPAQAASWLNAKTVCDRMSAFGHNALSMLVFLFSYLGDSFGSTKRIN